MAARDAKYPASTIKNKSVPVDMTTAQDGTGIMAVFLWKEKKISFHQIPPWMLLKDISM